MVGRPQASCPQPPHLALLSLWGVLTLAGSRGHPPPLRSSAVSGPRPVSPLGLSVLLRHPLRPSRAPRRVLLCAARPRPASPDPAPFTSLAAVQVAVGARGEARGSWTRFPVAVLAVFRSGEERARRGSSALWVPARDAACGCPRLLPGRHYLLLGGGPGAAVGGPGGRGPGLSAARGSLVLPWRDAWTRRLRRLQRRERRGRCGTA